ncbi:uncharacterized protein ASCRUDRAFT_40449 [Ascoidea rubescens DSM 1968]|uniref:S-adenosyl-L-methionine-dependent methyltransferase n=1 Tax=Ascoidea rubescens DSM 1968 TaxID=1344418 RepID=A0A1D2VNS8_9ASCO|nr:hypothetical protein ASCRUDRAFT_40449 [Ascoidea rubescens DSM 1968]ODV63271.1 hypothetical protein ASCRUDRAFT_40449 [Ascoidea rubescens DSM 1968]
MSYCKPVVGRHNGLGAWGLFKARYSTSNSNSPYTVFNRAIKLKQKANSSRNKDYDSVQYLKDESAKKLISRLSFINRSFDNVIDIGCESGNFEKVLFDNTILVCKDQEQNDFLKEFSKDKEVVRNKISNITMVDKCKELLFRNDFSFPNISLNKLVCDEEYLDSKDLIPDSYNLALSNLSMHWVNDIPSVFKKVFSLLSQKDTLFIGSIFGNDTLYELRSSLQLAELERKNGISPHVSPFITVQDLGNLLNKAGFKMLTIDIDEIVINYPGLFELLNDLQIMGENNCLYSSENKISKDTLLAADLIYKKFYGIENPHPAIDAESKICLPATFRLIYWIGWKDLTGNIKSAERGSGTVNLKDIL